MTALPLDTTPAPETATFRLDDARRRVDTALDRFLDTQTDRAPDACLRPLIDVVRDFTAGGKRLRPLFCYCGWVAAGHDPEEPALARVGAALELFHSFALVHDDVMDASDTRRGNPTVHKQFEARYPHQQDRRSAERFGANTAVLIGDICLTWSDELLQRSGIRPDRLHEAMPWITAMRTEVMAGQYLDIEQHEDTDDPAQRAWRVIRNKTATYTVERPLQIGAALAGADSGFLDELSRFGRALGESFQLRDDLLGVFGDPEVTGKPALDDLREGKRTMLVALTRKRASPRQLAVLDSLHGDPELDERGAGTLREIMRATGAAGEVERMVDARSENCLAVLDRMSIPAAADRVLRELVVAATRRHR